MEKEGPQDRFRVMVTPDPSMEEEEDVRLIDSATTLRGIGCHGDRPLRIVATLPAAQGTCPITVDASQLRKRFLFFINPSPPPPLQKKIVQNQSSVRIQITSFARQINSLIK